MSPTENVCNLNGEYPGTLLYNEPSVEYTTWRVGGAMVSQKHANFIINHRGSATATDIKALIHLVQTKVREQTTIELMREVHIIGDR
ncbi:UDP-N-acetylenolpyruvoylglucosamine reductase [Legionella steigerwaltii]|uniref:UDP-N-acetylenolpyruvoylglucosamine reductase n=1 Tax=Legionella steigerwaltii TaxID=460 RepID=A0A378L5B8_9GAMM|nr:UDP-N-acetylenolpyruvoylglucosamine reductase [Legionella steigerwaltii]STY22003.1 UDP-N-acetylenolpyruvoylglucosamine reductase [Legionella steigerwaltii]